MTVRHSATNDAKRPFVSQKLSAGFARLRKAPSQKGYDYKHLRNVGPSIGKRHKRHPDEREGFLGHAVRGTSRFYEGDVDETYLVELVNLIGVEYFGGKEK